MNADFFGHSRERLREGADAQKQERGALAGASLFVVLSIS
jgi:hypothetical protein